MSLFVEITHENIQPIEEGWGYAISVFAGAALGAAAVGAVLGPTHPISAIIAAPVGAAFGARDAYIGHTNKSLKFLKKALENPKLIKYIKDKCDKIYNEERKKNDKITKNLSPQRKKSMHELIKADNKEHAKSIGARFQHHGFMQKEISNGYMIGISFDTDHIQNLVLFLLDQSTDKVFKRTIPAPTTKELKYYNE